ncbi:Mis12 protein-domain-containing protein, partial [Amylostereum chailletii]
PPPPVPNILLLELLSFSPHFLLDQIINIANDSVGNAFEAMEKMLIRWADSRTDGDWDSTQEIEQGLVAFQTLLEFHTDVAFDFFETWSLRNVFAIPAHLHIVTPHHKGLNLHSPAGREAELLAEVEELRRKIDNQRRLKRLYTRAASKSALQAAHARRRLERLSFLQTAGGDTLVSLPAGVVSLYNTASSLPPLDVSQAETPLPDPGKRQWETGKAGYVNWAISQLITKSKK